MGNWISSTTVTQTTFAAYAYITPINAEDVVFLNNNKELTVTLQLNGQQSFTNSFKIRKPPVVLLHGYNTDASSWTPFFRSFYQNPGPRISFFLSITV